MPETIPLQIIIPLGIAGLSGCRLQVRSLQTGLLRRSVNAPEVASANGDGSYQGGFADGIPADATKNGFVQFELIYDGIVIDTRIGTFGDPEDGPFVIGKTPASLHGEQLDRIEAQSSQITLQNKTIVVNSSVAPGGTLTIYKGSDYRVRNRTALSVTIPDVGGSLAVILKDATKVESILFGAGKGGSANQITGTVDAANVTYQENNTTTIDIEVTKEATSSAAADDCYEWHIKGIAPSIGGEDGDEAVRLVGDLDLKPERARS